LRADAAERKLAGAAHQIRELMRQVATLQAIEPAEAPRAHPAVPLDSLGEHVQKILSEAWEGAQSLRQDAEQDASSIREKALAEGDRIVATARRKAETIGEELARRRHAYLEKLESERTRAVNQMAYLQEQRKIAIADLHRVRSLVDTTIAEVTLPSPTPPNAATTKASPRPAAGPPAAGPPAAGPPRAEAQISPAPRDPVPLRPTGVQTAPARRAAAVASAATMPVHRIATTNVRPEAPDASELVRNHRRSTGEDAPTTGVIRALAPREKPRERPSIFDFDEVDDPKL
jgi:hypothetical protein